ncbi:unnamed protein product [Rhizopus stolonifer]
MEHNMGWETLEPALAVNMVHILVTQPLSTIARPATVILERLCANGSEVFGYPTLHQAMQDEPDFIEVLVDRLLSPEYLLSTASLSLLIALLRHVTVEHQTQLVDAFEHSAMKKNVLRLMKNHPTDEMKLLIMNYQTVYLQNIGKRQTTALTGHIDQIEILQNIWKTAKVEHVKTLGLQKWKKIGFSSEVPQREFTRVGILGLEQMHSFVLKYPDLFSKLILEQIHRPEVKRCPFAKASIEVTDLLCDYWNVSSTKSLVFQPIVFDFDHLHSTTLQNFFRIFQEMEASIFDFSKVSALVRSQLQSTLNNNAVKDIHDFDKNMFGTAYSVIRDRRLKELEWADDLLGREAISNLRSRLSKQTFEFLKKQRISCLLEGAWFPCPNYRISINGSSSATLSSASTGKKWRYYKLSTSKRAILYGDFPDKTLRPLRHRIELSSVHEIKSIQIGFSHNTTLSSETQQDLVSFALYNEKNHPLAEFHCSSATQAAEWKDGFSMLLDKRFTSKETAELFHTLTEVGVKVKLLPIAGDRVEIPHGLEVPPVPPGLGTGFFYNVH